MASFGEQKVFINKDSDDELLDRIRSGGMIYPSDLGYISTHKPEKIVKVAFEGDHTTEYDRATNTMTVTQDIGGLLRDSNILAFADDSKIYFIDKTTLEIVSEFDRVK